MKTPTISVITVCKNAREQLIRLYQNLMPLMGTHDEWVVQDGASNDGTNNFLASLTDSRICWYSEMDEGIYDAMNRAVLKAHGDFVLFLGADDRLAISLDSVRYDLKAPATIYYGDVRLTSTGRRYAGRFTAVRLVRKNICQQSIFYPRVAFHDRQFNTRYPLQADWEFNMRCWCEGSLRFEYLPFVIAEYNDAGRSAQAEDEVLYNDYGHLLWRYFPWYIAMGPWVQWALSKLYRKLRSRSPHRARPLG